MALTNTQYETIMREYSRRQARQARALEKRRAYAYARIPQLEELDKETGQAGAALAFARLNGETGSAQKKQLQEISRKRAALLKENGLPADTLEMQYDCSDCKDTGYIGNRRCHCLRQAEINLLYTQSGLKDILAKENFHTFSMKYYPQELINPASGASSRQTMEFILGQAENFVSRFDNDHGNLLFYGETGLGKTFLSHCIAGALMDRGHSVMYYSAQDLFNDLADETFDNSADRSKAGSVSDIAVNCDLLIIDDLGTELTNSFVQSSLFLILNERLSRRLPTVISTNLTLPALRDAYSDRIFSRIQGSFRMLGFFGRDIRSQQRLEKLRSASASLQQK